MSVVQISTSDLLTNVSQQTLEPLFSAMFPNTSKTDDRPSEDAVSSLWKIPLSLRIDL